MPHRVARRKADPEILRDWAEGRYGSALEAVLNRLSRLEAIVDQLTMPEAWTRPQLRTFRDELEQAIEREEERHS